MCSGPEVSNCGGEDSHCEDQSFVCSAEGLSNYGGYCIKDESVKTLQVICKLKLTRIL